MVVTAVILAAIATVHSQYYNGEPLAPGEDYGPTDDTPSSYGRAQQRHGSNVYCSETAKERCCRMRAKTDEDGLIKVMRPRCPLRYTVKCCPPIAAMMRSNRYGGDPGSPDPGAPGGGGPMRPANLLSNLVKCIQTLITNLLQFKLTVKDGACCQVPLLKALCRPS